MIREKLRSGSIGVLHFMCGTIAGPAEAEFRETVAKLKKDGLIRFFGLSSCKIRHFTYLGERPPPQLFPPRELVAT